jgi:hypothetical protein
VCCKARHYLFIYLFTIWLLIYFTTPSVSQTMTSNGRKIGESGIGQDMAGSGRGLLQYWILPRLTEEKYETCRSGQSMPSIKSNVARSNRSVECHRRNSALCCACHCAFRLSDRNRHIVKSL